MSMKKELSLLFVTMTLLSLFSPVVSSNTLFEKTIPSNGKIINSNSFPDYTIWTQDGMYYANNSHQSIINKNSDATTVLNYVSELCSDGGYIYVKNGVYAVNGSPGVAGWNIPYDNIYVLGESWETIFTIPNNFNYVVINIAADNITLNNLSVDGNMANQDSRGDGFAHGIQVWGSSDFTIENCFVTGCWSEAIVAQNGANNGVIRGCTVKDTRISGITLYGKAHSDLITNTRNIGIIDCIAINCGLYEQLGNGIYFGGVDHCYGFNLYIEGASDCGLEIQGGINQESYSHGCMINNVTCFNTGNSGIFIDGSSLYPVFEPEITDFRIDNTTGLYISIYVSNAIISSGEIKNTKGTAVHLYEYVVGCKLSHISIQGSDNAVKIDGLGCTDNIFNQIESCAISGYNFEILSNNPRNTIENSQISVGNYGIYTLSDYTSIKDNFFSEIKLLPIYFESNFNYVVDNSIKDTPSSSTWAIYGVSSIGTTIESNQILSDSLNGGILLTGFGSKNNLIDNNYIDAKNNLGALGICIYSDIEVAVDNEISRNTIVNCSKGIIIKTNWVNNTVITNNQLFSCETSILDLGKFTSIISNTGYNPIGFIKNPFLKSGRVLIDQGGDSQVLTSGITYQNWGSPKIVYLENGIVNSVARNEQILFTTSNCTIILQPNDTIEVIFSEPPTINVYGL